MNPASYSEFKQSLERSFSVWFPSQAWGSKRFLINYTDGELQCRVMRRKISRKLSDEVKINLSPWIDEIYQNAFLAFSELKTDNNRLLSTDDISAHSQLERAWRVRAKVRSSIEEKASGYSCFQQTFIPAGRAFFTSIGRLVAGIEHAGSLDPATLKFARLFARWRDRSGFFVSDRNVAEINEFRNRTMLKLFGGKIQNKREAEFIEMEDGRKVPFSSLSSGQQELLPIWYFIDNLITMDALNSQRRGKDAKGEKEIVYIEEPEAHLFPESQATLLDILIANVLGSPNGSDRKLIITTHSPYLMSRLNVLIKAGTISRRKKRNKDINEIVPRSSWLKLEEITIQSIQEGKLVSIIDPEEGLIDAHFLDMISDSISKDFVELLNIEDSI